ncbi:NAD-dependent epimerase/dehydratase family protein [Pseudofrankia asymbiotica]|uniref:NAD-dependent dehydratase n=1 Tax=Pseudofrankia asymbiotica TaxID=1834516 RepID=A0A1V2ICP0_9ACTN|nr:NAD(P)-dependent oxidoreductase [Pseudofrankia asymbiotica]ONH30952.1 NAD-dependent dehydratase [Pseudofrankia asymbiotica]
MATERVLVTGAAGRIGTMLRPRLAKPGRVLRLLDVAPLEPAGQDEEAVVASITDLSALEEACAGIDAVVHLAGRSGESTWDEISALNINGTYNVLEAARRQGVRRVVFASSNHAVGFHPRDGDEAPDYLFPAPDTYYGVSKAAGEALGALYHHRYGLDVVCLRILTCAERPTDPRALATWLSPGDAARLVEASLTAPSPGFRVAWGVSDNTRGWFSQREARALGYEPSDDAEAYAAELTAQFGEPDLALADHAFVGGPFTTSVYDADRQIADRQISEA